MGSSRCRVLLVDDHPLFRRGVTQLIGAQPDFEVVGEAASGEEGVALTQTLHPDIVLLDVDMRGMGGLQALKQIKESGADTQVIMLSVSDAEMNLVTAVRSGADGYLLKDAEPEEMLEKLRQAARGEVIFTDSLMAMLVDAMRTGTPAPATDEALTERERQILQLIAGGKSNKHIARQLGISDGTVKVHVKNLLRKLHLRSRLEAAVWALNHRSEQPLRS
ncbi:MAG: Nitrate/nitrite response regulator protein NarL [Gammaproteobacteria bacterium]|nr:Nitrate/nitrite response regulator protein NarL [Gammaproteobacteria bacterium]